MQDEKGLNGSYRVLRLVLGDQLTMQHQWFSSPSDEVLYVMMEVRTETDYVWHHIQKACAFFAAMERFAQELVAAGHHVLYLALDNPLNLHSFASNCSRLISHYTITRFEYQLPDEYRLDETLKAYCNSLDIAWESYDTSHFYTSRGEASEFFGSRKGMVMENFYRHMRKKHGILVSGGVPVGGQWNFDQDNRKKLPRGHRPPPPLHFDNDVTSQYTRIIAADVKTTGTINPANFPWPLDRSQSLELLRYFTDYCLPLFGTFQDAMHTGEYSLYHSRLSFCMNTKMLSPREVIDAALLSWQESGSGIALNQLEGFIRQILGWREYMRGIYWMKMPGMEKANYFGNVRKLPEWYWTGNTRMKCMRECINQSLAHSYAHHIQRLMVTGNFALIAGIEPSEVDFWYLGIYIDAIEWAELPNTRGMSQFADGGLTASKPYAASANYINKMSNYCSGCHYNYKARTGDAACPFNSLYWDFFDRNRSKLKGNPRIAMVYRLWDRMAQQERAAILTRAQECLDTIDNL